MTESVEVRGGNTPFIDRFSMEFNRATSRKAAVPPVNHTRTGRIARHQRRPGAMHASSQGNNPA